MIIRKNAKAEKHVRWSTIRSCVVIVLLAAWSNVAFSGSFDLPWDINADYKASFAYALAVRTEAPSSALIDGGKNSTTSLPNAANFDDGDRNFAKWNPITNRLSTYGELKVKRDDFGIFSSASVFYDFAYRTPNDNDSPTTVNKYGPANQFTSQTRHYDGYRFHLLDAYAYGTFDAHDMSATVRVGRQVVSWGESLFFLGIASVQNPADASKQNVPGVELRDLLLPSNQVSLQVNLTDNLGIMGYYKLGFAPYELPPQGDYFSAADVVGPGASFLYVLANPLYPILGQLVPGTPTALTAPRAADEKAPNHGEYGLAANWQLTDKSSASLYYIRYHEGLPEPVIDIGLPNVVNLLPPITLADQTPLQQQVAAAYLIAQGLTPAIAAAAAPVLLQTGISQALPIPTSYHLKYFDNVSLYGASVSSHIGPVQVSGEYSFRRGASTLVSAAVPTPTRANVSQVLASFVYAANPTSFWDSAQIVGEGGYLYLHHLDPVGGVSKPVFCPETYAVSLLGQVNYSNVLPGWDLGFQTSFAQLFKGQPILAGSFGSLVGKNDRRVGIGVVGTRLGALQAGINYNMFLGKPDLNQRNLADRDNISLTIKYSL